ncbi:hypothetical protein ACT29H_05965 [Thermophagus sp. OGC60D27]|uniref:hypothetical protein n=1 Tax=Thermophagus sp. OGC60D27 TaxID=3458415 RepID=UPI0040376407
MLGGAAIGGFSGYLGGTIAAGGGFMANTSAIMVSSSFNSMWMIALSGGQMSPSISFGFGSFNFETGEFRSIFDWKDLSTMEKIGYGLGTFANASDVYGAIMGAYGDKAGEADLITKNDPIGHAELRTLPNEDGVSENLISVGPDWDRAVRGDSFWDAPGKNTWPTHSNDVDITVSKIRITNVRLDKIHEYVNTSLKSFRYKALSTNCVTSASNGLLKAGVLNIPFLRHPSLLQMQMLARRYAFLSPYMTEY